MKLSNHFVIRFVAASFITLSVFQNCSQPGALRVTSSESYSLAAVTPTCSPTQSQACESVNGQGIQFCSPSGDPLACQIESCNSGYLLLDGQCVPKACQPNAVATCVENNGAGNKTCNTKGTAFGSCVLNTCNAGYNLQNGTCVMNACASNSNVACSQNNGTGNKVCNSQGTGYSTCVLSACDSGYNFQKGSCVANACDPRSTTPCNENNGMGVKTCNSTGTGYGACQLNACVAGYNLQNGVCIANACVPNQNYACNENNGMGVKTCNSTGTGYGACQLNACVAGYNLQNGICVAKACVPDSVASCTENKGTGLKTCNAEGSGYGACQINACSEKYVFKNGVCVETCMSAITGNGSIATPYQIKNNTDFFCINKFSSNNVSSSRNNWILKTDLSIGANDYPNFNGQPLRNMDGTQFVLIVNLDNAVFDGDYHTIDYTVNCSAEQNLCKNPDNGSYPKKDIALFGGLTNSTIQKLKMTYSYVDSTNISGKATVQYASGIAGAAYHSKFFQVSASGVIQAGIQAAAGILILDGSGLIGSGYSTFEQVYSKVTAVSSPAGSAPPYLASIVTTSDHSLIKNSYGELNGHLMRINTGVISGFQSGMASYPNNLTNNIILENSYLKVQNTEDPDVCLPTDFVGMRNSGLAPTLSVTISNSFWISQSACDKRLIYPDSILPLRSDQYSSALQTYQFDPAVWVNGADGLPKLRWLNP